MARQALVRCLIYPLQCTGLAPVANTHREGKRANALTQIKSQRERYDVPLDEHTSFCKSLLRAEFRWKFENLSLSECLLSSSQVRR